MPMSGHEKNEKKMVVQKSEQPSHYIESTYEGLLFISP